MYNSINKMYNSISYDEPVYLNIYDLHKINNFIWYFGLGVFHTGIELYGTEYSYGLNSGIFGTSPKSIMNLPLRETIYLGNTNKGYSEIYNIIIELKNTFKENNYNMLNNNCNHFCEMMSYKIVGTKIPNYINRLASFGRKVSCVIPYNLNNSQNGITYKNTDIIDIESQEYNRDDKYYNREDKDYNSNEDYNSEDGLIEIKIDDDIDYIDNYNLKND